MKTSRRDFVKMSSLAALLGAIGGQVVTFGQKAWAQAIPDVLKSLNYVANAAEAKPARVDKPIPGAGMMPAGKQFCRNCTLFSGEINKKADGPCKLAPTFKVAHSGYCNSYAPSPAAKPELA